MMIYISIDHLLSAEGNEVDLIAGFTFSAGLGPQEVIRHRIKTNTKPIFAIFYSGLTHLTWISSFILSSLVYFLRGILVKWELNFIELFLSMGKD